MKAQFSSISPGVGITWHIGLTLLFGCDSYFSLFLSLAPLRSLSWGLDYGISLSWCVFTCRSRAMARCWLMLLQCFAATCVAVLCFFRHRTPHLRLRINFEQKITQWQPSPPDRRLDASCPLSLSTPLSIDHVRPGSGLQLDHVPGCFFPKHFPPRFPLSEGSGQAPRFLRGHACKTE